ncbi:DNA polymerase III subunit delta [Bordetella pseudohinzii]|uniref:DNA polymerase III subunit delta n=1 Tax=Bordetella pseudohinzii TaxID=1331258 RepID=A0A0J6C8L6_9BORD|nr:DNA polymerase III subunit delta [Bordetella pseudohinzii]ANY15299.1 DNA polymerase III subunit delta [Bordetella pseudohinzii]KMM27398.1 DNA polymerase III subunit delta [Bordetella pseudohinzii]KXA80517.1 DNA polymerase III subunit delta [Bordetella pseudohinzii]KXA82427.1 DNA polymerase III subunit delta [Bordetella pseudohinzii]CUI88320.1 DNA polymerase III subunit delta [Bordetella pseudohinzii]
MAQILDADGLIDHLRRGPLATLYTLSGDEPLLVTEAGDALRAAARQAGYTDRSSLVMDARGDWSAVLAATQSVSLFGDRRLLEIKIPTGKPGKAGADTLTRLAERQPDADTLVVVSLPRLDRATRESKWALALARGGVSAEIPTIERGRLPAWIGARLARQNQRVDGATLQWMADKVEGNLLAAHQEILKLGLLYPEGELAAEDVERAVLNVARYDVFGLRDAMLAGDIGRTVRMLDGLRAEGEALPLVLWAVGEEIRLLARIAEARQHRQDVGALMRRLRVFGAHERLALQALGRVPPQAWPAAVQHAHEVDRLIKGLTVPGRLADPWEEMTRLALRVAAAGARG